MTLEPDAPGDRPKSWWRRPLTQPGLILVVSVGLVLTANIRFLSEAARAFPPSEGNLGFLLTLPLMICALHVLLLTSLSSRFTTRPLLTLLLLTAAPVAYFSDRMGVMVDATMLRNVLYTDTREAAELLNPELIVRTVLLGVLPAIVVWWIPLRYRNWRTEALGKLRLIAGSLVVLIGLPLLLGDHYASFLREYKSIRHYANPVAPLVAAYKLGAAWMASADPESPAPVGLDAHLPDEHTDRELMILVVGETARMDHFSLYGYERDTNPELRREPGLLVYRNVTSCGTSTAISLPCMFSFEGRGTFDVDDAQRTENVLDVLQRAGVSVLWRDNNSDSKGVALRVPFEDFRSPDVNPVCDVECRDVGMLDGLQEYIDRQTGDVLIVLHQMGNHGPAYFKRYPPEFERFTPACRSAKLSDCTREEIGNAYDNAILYTDWFLARVLDLVKANSGEFEAAMLYISDHGESLGEHRLYLHGLPYALAPDEQIQVPMLMWVGDRRDVDLDSAQTHAIGRTSQDALSHSLLRYFEVETEALDPELAAFGLEETEAPADVPQP